MSLVSISTGALDLARGRFVSPDGDVTALTTRETALLAWLADRPGADVSRDQLRQAVWGQHTDSLSRAVDTTVARLRRKIERDSRVPEVLCTAHGDGYRLVVGSPAAVLPVATPSVRLVLGERRLDLAAGVITGPDGALALTSQERRLLEVLVAQRGLVEAARLARLARVDGGADAIPNAILRLRRKIEADPRAPRWLIGVRGGYRLDLPEAPAANQPMFALAQEACTLAELDDCVIYLRRGDQLLQIAAHGPKATGPAAIVAPIRLQVGEGIVGAAARTGAVQLVPDVRADPRYVPDVLPARSELAVPIVNGDRVVGVIDSESKRLGAYGDLQRQVLQSLARIASVFAGSGELALAS